MPHARRIGLVLRLCVALAAACISPSSLRAADRDSDLRAMIGQMLLIGFAGTAPNGQAARRVASQIARGEIGGVILMDRNVTSRNQVRALTARLRNAGHPLPPIISVDQEGGLVQRLSARKGFKAYPTARTIARLYKPDKALLIYRSMALELADAGFNLNYGPVVDLNLNRANPVIARLGRSYGSKPETVLAYARAFITAHREANVLTSVKHFPGHGSSWADSHKRFVDLTKTWRKIELEPYRALVREGAVDTIMVGHLFHPDFSGGRRLPATLAPTAINGWIRRKLAYQGVVITDDLEMAAIKKHHDLKDTLVRAVNSGNDILMFSSAGSDPKFVPRATQIIFDAVKSGTIPREHVAQSYARIVALKQRLKPAGQRPPGFTSAIR